MTRRSSGILDEAAIKQAGAQVFGEGAGVTHRGWTIETCKAPISKDSELDTYKERLGSAKSIPEQCFGDSYLRLTHAQSGVCLAFTAMDALQAWWTDDRPPVQVGAAQDWLRSRQKDVESSGAVTLEYDWTYTTSYKGSLQIDSQTAPSTSGRSIPEWAPCDEQLDKALLLARDPILFYDEVLLYESELDDNGASQLCVKVRVMPRCWFVLLRFWLRVDHVLVRLYETRYLCAFSSSSEALLEVPHVTREVRCCEGTFQELRAAGAPPDGPAYQDADSTSTALQAAAPVGITQFRTEKLVLRASQGQQS